MAADEELIRVESGPILVASGQPGLFGLHKQSQTTGKRPEENFNKLTLFLCDGDGWANE